MSQFFLATINMSISASYIVLAVLLLRPLLKKTPKWIAVVLWGIVAVRLICPFSVESILSLIPSAETVSPNIMMDRTPEINTGIPIINQAINPVISGSFAPDPGTSANPLQLWIPTFAGTWIVGMAMLLTYTVISYVKVKRKVGIAVLLRNNIYQSENVGSPFVLGIIKPKIYLPFDINHKDMEYVVAHELAHIRRKDHWWKPLGFLLLTLHWFNPLMWLGYILLCRDIELACDEKVIKELDRDARADYSQALLSCSVSRRTVAACPLAFGEEGVKNRVRAVLNYRKPAFWVIIAAVIACTAVAVCFLTDPPEKRENSSAPSKSDVEQLRQQYPQYFGVDDSDGLDIYVWQMVPNAYAFGLLPHSEEPRDWADGELLNLIGVDAEQMRAILSDYNTEETDVHIILWQNPLSSHLAPWHIVTEGETEEQRLRNYGEPIRRMLFGERIEPASVYGSYILVNDKDAIRFSITLNEDGTYQYYEGFFSSHIGMGEYTYEDGIVTLVDTHIPGVNGSLTRTYKFRFKDGKLVFLAEESDEFMYTALPDGAEFVRETNPGK